MWKSGVDHQKCYAMNLLVLNLVLLLIVQATTAESSVYSSDGDIKIVLILKSCRNSSQQTPFLRQSLINSALWTVQRLNFLEFTNPLSLGVSIWEACDDVDYYNTFFKLFQERDDRFVIGTISEIGLKPRIRKFCDILNVRTRSLVKYLQPMVKAVTEFLHNYNFKDDVVVGAPSEVIVNEFFKLSRARLMCVKEYFVYDTNFEYSPVNSSETLVIFGDHSHLSYFVQNFEDAGRGNLTVLLVPLDGSVINDLPANMYILLPPHNAPTQDYNKTVNFLPTPLLFDIASPILSYAQNLRLFMDVHCNDTLYKVNCLRSKYDDDRNLFLDMSQILDLIKIEPLKSAFVYEIFKSQNVSRQYRKILQYSVFDNNFTVLDATAIDGDSEWENASLCQREMSKCERSCKNFVYSTPLNKYIVGEVHIRVRSEPWVYAFLSISLLGVVFCLAILTFLIVCICRRDILDGNPVLTMLLLVAVMLIYSSVIPLSLEGTKSRTESICLARSLSATLSLAFAFSLILSRCILLATASKEIGFMSHIAGPVQSFLCLFIFGVQAALSLQVMGRCSDIFKDNSFLYLLSYNAMLLLLLLCLCPLIFKCQRNYREGKYFVIAVCLICCAWGGWMTSYGLLDEEWKDICLCFGLVSTASIVLGAVFVPRTYLMTLAAARDKITSTIPSLPTATSTLDIYRAATQPVYDCVNVAAINAVTVARAGMNLSQQPDLYSCPNMPEDMDFDRHCCSTPVPSDKVTRF